MNYTVTVLPGDGIGPEVIGETIKVFQSISSRYGHQFNFRTGLIGGAAIDQFGTALPEETLQMCKDTDAVLFGAVGGPKWDHVNAAVRPEQGILAIRKGLGLYANVRPVKVYPAIINSSPIKPELLKNVDMIILRELTGGLYFGKPKKRWKTTTGKRRGVDTLKYTEEEVERIVRMGFEMARARRKRLTSTDKFNVLESSRMWREVTTEVATDYPDVELEHILADNLAMQIIRDPEHFDVIVAENTFGDIISDEASVLCGSLGMLPSASLSSLTGTTNTGSQSVGLYEPIHGSAPDIAGKGIANPIGTILSGAMLLRYSLGLHEEAHAIEEAVEGVLADGYKTADIAGVEDNVVSTREIGDVIAGSL